MSIRADKTQKNQSRSFVNKPSQKQSRGGPLFQFVDNRPESIEQRNLQEMADHSSRASPLKAIQEMKNNTPQTKRYTHQSKTIANAIAQKKSDRQQSFRFVGNQANSKGAVIQRAINIEDKHGNINSMSPEQVYKTYFNGGDKERDLLRQTGAHVDDIKDILSRYDKANKTLKSQSLNSSVHQDLLQSFFQHSYHQRRNANNAGTASANNDIPDNAPRMKIYRTMDIMEFASIKAWLENQSVVSGKLTVENEKVNSAVNALQAVAPESLPIKHHLGGFDQASHYASPIPGKPKFLLEFVLKKGALRELQDPNTVALQSGQSERSTIGNIAAWHKTRGNTPGVASKNEGYTAGKIGLKNESTAGESLSIAVGKNAKETQALFQEMVSRINLVKVVEG